MTINLPRCEFTGIERLGCACPACESFTMTDQEKSLRSGVINIRDLEAQVGRPVPEYRMKVRSLDTTAASRRWQQTDLIACDHDSRSTRLCSSCEVLFENLIGDIPALVENLEEAIARNVRFVDHGSSTSPDESPLGLYRAASDALRRLRDTLVYPSEAVRRRDRPDLAAQVATGASRWMLSHWQDVLRHVDIRGVAHRVSLATQRAHRVIDRPRDLMFLGDCPRACGAQLWPERGAVSVACPNEACGWAGSVDELIREWLSTGDDRYLTERELLLALPTLTRRTLGRWIAHEGVPRQEMSRPFWQEDGTLSAKTYMAYRLGSVRELLVEQQLDEQVRATEADGTLTTQQVAQRTGLTEALIWKLVERGRLKPVRVGAKPLRFTVDEVAKLSGRRAS